MAVKVAVSEAVDRGLGEKTSSATSSSQAISRTVNASSNIQSAPGNNRRLREGLPWSPQAMVLLQSCQAHTPHTYTAQAFVLCLEHMDCNG